MTELMTWVKLMEYLSHNLAGSYADSIEVMLCEGHTNDPDFDYDRFAVRLQKTARARTLRKTPAGPRPDMPSGLTALAAHAAATWLSSYLQAELPPEPGGGGLHHDLRMLVDAIWNPNDTWGVLHNDYGRLARSTAHRADELRQIRAYQTVRQLSGYATTSDINAAHGRLVHNTLRLALPLDVEHRPGRSHPPYLSLAKALDRVLVSQAPVAGPPLDWPTVSAAGRAPATGATVQAEVDATTPAARPHPLRTRWAPEDTSTAHEAFDKALRAQPAELVAGPPGDGRGVLTMLWAGRPSDPDAESNEIEQVLAAASSPRVPNARSARMWERVHAGLVELAGEIAARTLHEIIAEEHDGPDGFEALTTLINHIYSGHQPASSCSNPVMAVSRMLRTANGTDLLPRWQNRAIRTIIHRHNSRATPGVRPDALICAAVADHCRAYTRTIAQVRTQVTAARLNATAL